MRGDGKHEVKEKGKTKRQVGKSKTRKFQKYKQGELVY
jgi:hypothetical protein